MKSDTPTHYKTGGKKPTLDPAAFRAFLGDIKLAPKTSGG